MNFAQLRYLIRSDIHRYHGRTSVWIFIKAFLVGEGERYGIWLRLAQFCGSRPWIWAGPFLVCRLMLRHLSFKFGIGIPHGARIGPGLCIGHIGLIVITKQAVIGRNCNLSHEVTIGVSARGPRAGAPVIGDNVYIGPGAKIFGRVVVGNYVAIGANCVVTKDVPDHAVVVGVPGQVISQQGSEGYINRTDYEEGPSIGPSAPEDENLH